LGWAGIKGEKERGKRKDLHFFEIDSNTFKLKSNSRIQIQTQIEQQTIKQCKAA